MNNLGDKILNQNTLLNKYYNNNNNNTTTTTILNIDTINTEIINKDISTKENIVLVNNYTIFKDSIFYFLVSLYIYHYIYTNIFCKL